MNEITATRKYMSKLKDICIEDGVGAAIWHEFKSTAFSALYRLGNLYALIEDYADTNIKADAALAGQYKPDSISTLSSDIDSNEITNQRHESILTGKFVY